MADGDTRGEAEALQRPQAGKRSGNDRRLSYRSRNAVAIRRQIPPRIQCSHSLEATPPGSTVEIRWGALAGKKEADARRRETAAKEHVTRDVQPGEHPFGEPGCQGL